MIGIKIVGGSLYQWDTGRKVSIQTCEKQKIAQVHFSHSGMQNALVVTPAEENGVAVANIPNILLQSAQNLTVYVVIVDADERKTVIENTFSVVARSKPDDYVYTETELLNYEQLEKRIKKLEDTPIDGEVVAAAVGDYLESNPITETDPTVPEWAKQSEKPSYTANEVGALPSSTKIPNKTSDLTNDSGYITGETDPTVPQWAKNPTKPIYTATEVGADASGTADTKVSEHNVSEEAHNDIRLLVQGLTDRLNTLADSDDDTLDQMSEIVAYIKSNKTLIDAITTSKVSVADIVDNLTTNVSNKPLSAAQGVALKALIDGIVIPETLPNPQKLIFSGAVTGEYDGSTELNVNIPESSGGGSYELPIMSDTQLGGGKAVSKTDEDVPVAVDPSTGQLFVPTYPENTSSSATPRQEMQNTNTNVTLEPNKLYVFPEMASLTVTLAEPSDANVSNEYHFFFTSGATATTLTLNDVLSDAYSIEANMKYEVSILEGVAYIKGVSMSEA